MKPSNSDRWENASTGVMPTATTSQQRPRRTVSVVIPVYNSRDSLEPLCERLSAVLTQHASEFEVIFVNDGSRDESWAVLERITDVFGFARAIDLMRNYGQHNALLCGLRATRGEIVITMDDDLQHPPEEIVHLLDKLEEGFDVVYGVPATEQHGIFRNVASRLTKIALQSAMGVDTARNVSAFRAIRAEVCKAFAEYRNTYVAIDVLLTWGTHKFGSVRVRHDPRRVGPSTYTFGKLIRHALNMMTGFSTLPLRMASLIGFGFTVFGGAVLVYVIGRAVFGEGRVPGFPFLASIIAIFSGAQLFALGIIGEYLARMHTRAMDKPSYVVRRMLVVQSPIENQQTPSHS